MEKQNALLHQQMDDMASRSRQVQQQQQQQQLDLSFSEEGKTTEQILEILRYDSWVLVSASIRRAPRSVWLEFENVRAL